MFTLNCNGRILQLTRPWVMGIINATPDSFFAASRRQETEEVLALAGKMQRDGVDIIDIGGQSTRPGSTTISEAEELARVIPAIEALHKHFPEIPISVDTYYGKVAMEAAAAGASVINDISAGSIDPDMINLVAQTGLPYIFMHMKGTPATMTQHTQYQNLTGDITDFFIHGLARIRKAGIKDVIIDPGFGFSKTIAQNFQLLRELTALQVLGCPVLVGLSRKSTIYKTLDIDPSDALNGSTVLHTIALMNGANLLRVHDVKEAVEAVKLTEAFKGK